MDNIFALIVLACQKALLEGKIPDQELSEDRLTIAKALLMHSYDRDRIISLLAFLKNFLYINDEKINSIFNEQIIQSAGGTINMGVIDVIKKQERQEGLQQGRREIINNLLKQTDFDDAMIASLTGATASLVKKIRSELEKKK